jgi:dihydroorotase
MLYTAGHLTQGFRYHLYCLPLLKFIEDREALREAVTDHHNKKFFAGTDSAPHTKKTTPCGCAAGCYTGGIAPQLYAEAFEEAGTDLSTPLGAEIFMRFLCTNGAAFYDLPLPKETFTLVREAQEAKPLETDEGVITPLPLGFDPPRALKWRIA